MSQERAVQQQRELTTLMVVYSSYSDIPSSPREPSGLLSGEAVTEESFGSPVEETKVQSKTRPPLEKMHLQFPAT